MLRTLLIILMIRSKRVMIGSVRSLNSYQREFARRILYKYSRKAFIGHINFECLSMVFSNSLSMLDKKL